MIKQMTKYSFVVFHQDTPAFLDTLKSLGLMDITRSSKPATENSRKLFDEIQRYSTVLKQLKTVRKESCSEKPLPESGIDNAEEVVARCQTLTDECRAIKAELVLLTDEYNAALPWGAFEKDTLEKIKALGLTPCFVSIPAKKFNESLREKYALEIISQTSDKVNMVILLPAGERLKGKFKTVDPPKESAGIIQECIAEKEALLEKKEAELETLVAGIEAVSNKMEALKCEAEVLLAGESSIKAAENTIDVFTGFAPKESSAEIATALDNCSDGVYWSSEDAKVEDNPPIALKNNRFTRMFSVLTDMYGRPAYNEFDPTPYISVFFLLFFAMCMGDAGYGILLIIIALLLRKAKGAAKFAPLVMTLGIATLVVGFLLHTFFGIDISQVSWIPDGAKKFMITGKIAGYDAQMVLALVIGVIHICVAMTVKAIYAVKKNGFANSLGTIGWTLLIVGGVIIGAIALGANLEKSLVKTIVIVLGIVSAIGIFLLNNIHRNPLKNIGSGLWETYNTVTGLLGDVLSYIRLYALGLAGGMLGAAFNQLGGMVLGDSQGFSIMWIFFIIIVVFGHVLNLAMCCLGAFVHPLRLNFLEFFKNSGYEGSGKTYKPLTTNK